MLMAYIWPVIAGKKALSPPGKAVFSALCA